VFAYGLPLLVVSFNVGITVGYFDRNQVNEELCNAGTQPVNCIIILTNKFHLSKKLLPALKRSKMFTIFQQK